MNSHKEILVVGGGVIGAFCAWELSRAGRAVALVDQERIGAGCSHGNCGLVSPSHVFPMAGPGAIQKALTALVQKNSPFYIKPRLD